MKLCTAMDLHSNRKLNFNLPLLSTRQPGGLTGEENTCRNTNARIPFSWEEAPGKPKDKDRHDFQDQDTPRPRLPPCRWRQEKAAAAAAKTKTDNDATRDVRNNADADHHDDGCDADVEDDGDEEEEDAFSDAVDVMSLTEAIDIVQKAEDDHHHHLLDGLNLVSADFSDHSSPNFMIERFLPDATALAAASSVLYGSNNLSSKKLPYSFELSDEYGSHGRRSDSDCSSQQKGCGLEFFFPWRIKHKLCGVKNPVIRQVSPTNNNNNNNNNVLQ